MNHFYLAQKESFNKRLIPLLWTSAKTYYEQFGKQTNNWSWSDPWLVFDNSVEQILEICEQRPPNVFGFSVYVWNELFMNQLAKQIKQLYPDCTIIYGGPHVDVKYNENFFKDYPWVDAVCPSDGYGEIIIKELLDHWPVADWNNVPYVWYTNSQRERLFSTQGIEKRSFEWPTNIYQAQEKHFAPHIDSINSIVIETTRGCPYKCIYCDWGGGTYTKISAKPYTTVLDEIDWISKNKIQNIYVASANFGILPIDVDIAQHLINVHRANGYPKNVHVESAKNNIDRVTEITQLLVKHELINHHIVTLQNVNEEIKNNIERVDVPLHKQSQLVQSLKKINPNLPIKVETITGLPGDSYKATLDQINDLFNHNLPMPRSHVWMLLPEAPAYSQEMRDKFQIKTTRSLFVTYPYVVKPEHQQLQQVESFFFDATTNVEMVVGTYSYSVDEFVDMYMMVSLAMACEYFDFQNNLAKYMMQYHNVQPGELLDVIYKSCIMQSQKFSNDLLSQQFVKLRTQQKDCATGSAANNLVDIDVDFPLQFSTPVHMAFLILQNPKTFFDTVGQELADHYQDSKIKSLCEFVANCVIGFDYNPDSGKVFSSNYNWLEYCYTDQELKLHECEYEISDKDVWCNNQWQAIDWHTVPDTLPKLTQFAYKQILDAASKISKTIQRRN